MKAVATSVFPILSCAFFVICSCWIGRSAQSDLPVRPVVNPIVIRFANKAWLLNELDKQARNHIWGQSDLTNTIVLQTEVRIYPHDQTVMCEFTYSASIPKRPWRVKVGYNGKILGVERVAASHATESGGAGSNGIPVAIVLKEKEWRLSELDKLARNHVWGQSGSPAGAVPGASVRIYPRDKTVMCEFTYASGFSRPFWDVKIGYDGKVQRVRQGIVREG